jgi:hypothetical protein
MASNNSLECGLYGQSYRQLNYHFTLHIQHRSWHYLQDHYTYFFLLPQSPIRQRRAIHGYLKVLYEPDKQYTQGTVRPDYASMCCPNRCGVIHRTCADLNTLAIIISPTKQSNNGFYLDRIFRQIDLINKRDANRNITKAAPTFDYIENKAIEEEYRKG